MFMIVDHGIFIFTMIKCGTLKQLLKFFVLLHKAVCLWIISSFTNHYICISCNILFHEPLNLHCNKFLLQKYFIRQISPILFYHNL